MLFARRHRIRDAIRGTLDGRRPTLEFGPGLGPNSSGESSSTYDTVQLEVHRPNPRS